MFGMLLQTSTAVAQTTTGAVTVASADGSELAEIIVTARKTIELLQDTPMSVAVITADAIEKTGATTLEDLGRETAGLNIVSAAPGQNQIILRGLSGNNTVGFYLDDTPLSIGIGNAVQPTNFDIDPALFDLNRVEVLRGPQGSLYGASSFGGTVRYITNQPNLAEEHVTAQVTASGTEDGGFNEEADGLINQPIIPGYLAVRAMVFDRNNSGYIDQYPAANDLDLDSAQQLLTFFESQPDLLGRQVGDRASDRANVRSNWRVALRRQLKADCPCHQRGHQLPRDRPLYPSTLTYVPFSRSADIHSHVRHQLLNDGTRTTDIDIRAVSY